MQNKLKRLLIDLLPIVFWCIAIVLLIAFAYKNSSLQLWQVALLTLAGLIINYFLSLFFHELGHLAFAKKNKAKTASVNFGLFTVDKKQKRVKLFTAFGENAGSSEFVTVDKISAEKVRSIAFGGLLGEAPVMPVKTYSPARFIHRGGRIPAPIHSLKN